VLICEQEMAERYPNIELINAYLPDPFGTHHSKMLILIRHDGCAQVIIHTANMISKDWTNMTQAVWRSPLLPFHAASAVSSGPYTVGSGDRFLVDLLCYLGKYEKRLRRLIDQLALYDFSAIRAAFLGSAPSRQVVSAADPTTQTSFGWLGLQQILSSIPITAWTNTKKPPHIVLQVSSIATLGAAPTWLSHFQSVLSRLRTPQQFPSSMQPEFNIIFPTPEEVRTSLDGYESGGSIHIKVQSAQQQKQLQYLHPLLCHWKQPSSSSPTASTESRQEAHRGLAAPHIKTYIRFSDATHKSIDWALLTSANLSKQAWGDVTNKQGEVRIQSYETGVLVWPELFVEPGYEASMVPTFGDDMPKSHDVSTEASLQHQLEAKAADKAAEDDEETEDENDEDVETEDENTGVQHSQNGVTQMSNNEKVPIHNSDKKRIVVGLRMPYDLPLSSYNAKDKPWCATQQYTDPDWKGRVWAGFHPR
jgi:tyrosyl-DNA phosphodiesterase-1